MIIYNSFFPVKKAFLLKKLCVCYNTPFCLCIISLLLKYDLNKDVFIAYPRSTLYTYYSDRRCRLTNYFNREIHHVMSQNICSMTGINVYKCDINVNTNAHMHTPTRLHIHPWTWSQIVMKNLSCDTKLTTVFIYFLHVIGLFKRHKSYRKKGDIMFLVFL